MIVDDVVVVGAARTPQGRLKGRLSSLTAPQLGAIAIRGALEKAGIPADAVDAVLVGQVLAAGSGQNPARQAAIGAGIGWDVHAGSVNKVCLSGLTAVIDATRMLRLGDATVVVAAGMESMSQAPHLLMGSRNGWAYGSVEVLDHLAYDGLTDAYDHESMGASTERLNERYEVTREAQDAVAARSHQRAAAAQSAGRFEREIVAIDTPAGRVLADETIRAGTTVEKLAGLKAVFESEELSKRFPQIQWSTTAGNASQMTDGASAMLIMSEERALQLGLRPRARFVAFDVVGDDPLYMLTAPIPATQRVLAKARMQLGDIAHYEINEAFASVPLAWQKELGADGERLNPRGGAIALGHPLGASGLRLMTTMLHALEDSGQRYGLQSMCEAGGMANATIIEVLR